MLRLSSLRAKTILGIVVIEGLLLAVLVYGTTRLVEDNTARALGERAGTTAQLFAAAATEPLLSYDLATLNTLVSQVQSNRGVLYARVRRSDGHVMAEAGDGNLLARAFQADKHHRQVEDGVLDRVHGITIGELSYGQVEVGYDVGEIHKAVAAAREQALFFSALLLAVSLVAAFALGVYLTRGFSRLREGAARLSAGELGYSISTQGGDELAETAMAFNQMSQRLAELANQQEGFRSRLAFLADHDSLTGLMNRRRLYEELDKWIRYAQRYQRPISLLFIDVDEFKRINDTFGHQAGDALIEHVADLLKLGIRDTDFLSRLGGDEFGVLLTEADVIEANVVATRLLRSLAEADFIVQAYKLHVTASIGVAVCPIHASDVEELIARADIAMYRAKREGKNRVHVFTPEDERRDAEQITMRWETKIKEALRDQRFHLFYQPLRALNGQQGERYEALVRMRDTDDSWVMPGVFLETAERFGLIEAIDLEVVRIACEKLVEARHLGRDLRLSVNLSGYEFNKLSVCEEITRRVERAGINPGALTFELTETSALVNIERAEQFVRELRSIGCRVAIDDFGAGFTSLSYLRSFPVDEIKIDGSFVKQLDHNNHDQALVKAVTEMAHAIGLKVAAEFVENEQILAVLERFGVDYAQGYYIGRPAPLNWERETASRLGSV